MRHCLTTIFLAVTCLTSHADEKLDFAADVAPLLQDHCVRCHSSNNRKGDVSLETVKDLRENEYVVAGKPAESHLIDLIAQIDFSVLPRQLRKTAPLRQQPALR